MNPDMGFRDRVESLVAQIPKGRLMTYGQLAALAGSPVAARVVGGIAHFGDPNLPWQRVVNKTGGLAAGYPGGRESHGLTLMTEGLVIQGGKADINKLIWWPESSSK